MPDVCKNSYIQIHYGLLQQAVSLHIKSGRLASWSVPRTAARHGGLSILHRPKSQETGETANGLRSPVPALSILILLDFSVDAHTLLATCCREIFISSQM